MWIVRKLFWVVRRPGPQRKGFKKPFTEKFSRGGRGGIYPLFHEEKNEEKIGPKTGFSG